MNLVNAIKRQKYKREIEKQLFKLAPEVLKHKNMSSAIEKLYLQGLVEQHEIIQFEMKLKSSAFCMDVESIFRRFGFQVYCSIHKIEMEGDDQNLFARLNQIAAPYWPDELCQTTWGLRIPYKNKWTSTMLKNQIYEFTDIRTEDTNKRIKNLLMKYDFSSLYCFPVHIEGELKGMLTIVASETVFLFDDLLDELRKKQREAEMVLSLQEKELDSRKIQKVKVLLSPDFRIIYAEEDLSSLVGYEPDEIVHLEKAESFLHCDEKSDVMQLLGFCSLYGAAVRKVLRLRHKSGDYRVVEALSRPVLDERKEVKYIETCLAVNTMKCHRYEEQLNLGV